MYISENCIYFNEFSLKTIDKIPPGNWLLCKNETTGELFLKSKPEFTLPEKLYGDVSKVSSKFLNTFKNTTKNFGILLTGMKGTGKSLLARKLCIDSNLPVIIITQAFKGPELMDFFTKARHELVIFLDEFEKTYAKAEEQEGLLSFFEGAFSSKFMFILTINELNRMSSYMLNRPGRLHYVKNYSGLTSSMIREIANDTLLNKDHIEEIIFCCAYLGEISVDMLSSFIWECNLYPNEKPKALLKDLNLVPESGYWDVEIYRNGVKVAKDKAYKSPLSGENVCLDFYINPSVTPEQKLKMNRKELDEYINTNRVYTDIDWLASECVIVINDDYSIDISRKEDNPDTDEDNHGLTLKYIKTSKYSFTI